MARVVMMMVINTLVVMYTLVMNTLVVKNTLVVVLVVNTMLVSNFDSRNWGINYRITMITNFEIHNFLIKRRLYKL